jgi:hypothetical protein
VGLVTVLERVINKIKLLLGGPCLLFLLYFKKCSLSCNPRLYLYSQGVQRRVPKESKNYIIGPAGSNHMISKDTWPFFSKLGNNKTNMFIPKIQESVSNVHSIVLICLSDLDISLQMTCLQHVYVCFFTLPINWIKFLKNILINYNTHSEVLEIRIMYELIKN